ncbi:erkB [Symbiodinium microadriaticum]|nr:erkB [Symbiodinium microadriaticum]CAE7903281.1 erkB [Symbiodinium sp. KB8]
MLRDPTKFDKFAMKKVLYAFNNSTDAQRTYREVSYLMELGSHTNIVYVHDVLVSADDKHLYIVTDLMESDLCRAIKCNSLGIVHKSLISYQVLRALKYIHSAGVMHRDLKPGNIFVDRNCQVLVGDFGLARSSPIDPTSGDGVMLTDYIGPRWYRSPEQLLGARCYFTAVDIWAWGCIVAEMHLGKPILKGSSTIDMMHNIVELLGTPLEADVDAMQAQYAHMSLQQLPISLPTLAFAEIIPDCSQVLCDLLELCFQWNPMKRLTAVEALRHPFLSAFHDPDAEPVFGHRLELTLPDGHKFSTSQYRDQMYADIIGLEKSKLRVDETRKAQALLEAMEEQDIP